MTSSTSTTSSAVNGSALMNSLGAGSGVDTKSLAANLVEAERAPRKNILDNSIAKSEAKISGYAAMMVNLDTLKTAFKALDDPSDLSSLTASVSNSSALSMTVATGAVPGSQSVEVLSLARPQRTASAGFTAANAQLNGGVAFNLQLTTNGSTQQIPVTAANTTPAGMVSAINSAKLGVTAQLMNTNDGSANPYKIILTGTMGVANAFTLVSDDASGQAEQQTLTFNPATVAGNISVGGVQVSVDAGDDAAAIAAKVKTALVADDLVNSKTGRSYTVNQDGSLTLAFAQSEGDVAAVSVVDTDSTGATASVATSLQYVARTVDFSSSLQTAADAKLKINGLEISRSSNTITDAISGVTLNLLGKTPTDTPAVIAATRDTTALKVKINALVKSFNDALSDFAILSGPKNTTDTTDIYSGSLANDSTVSQVKSQLRSMFTENSSTPGTNISALRDIGISITKTGTLEFDEKKFDVAATDNFDGIVTALTADKENKSEYGVSSRGIAGDAVKRLGDMMKSTGIISTQSTNTQQQVTRYKADLEKLETRMASLLKRYTSSFAAMDSFVGEATSLRASLKSQFDNMNSSNN